MSGWSGLQERYLRDPISIRLGGLAANLSRISTFSDHPGHADAVSRLVRESEFFIEWTARDLNIEQLTELAELQRLLAGWHYSWPHVWAEPSSRASLANDAEHWSERILQLSGLVPLNDRGHR